VKYDFEVYINEPLPFDRQISKYFRKNDPLIIFEVGSCEGEDSIRLKRRFPNAIIYTFEPLPSNVKKIKEHFKKYDLPTKRVFQLALSDSNGTAEFFVSSGQPTHIPESEKSDHWDFGNKSSSLLPPKEHKKTLSWIKFKDKVKVKTQRLDDFCRQNQISKIDFAYIDVQGAELMVLNGANDMLSKISSVWLEVEAIELYANQPLKDDVEKFMATNGFVKVMDTVNEVSGDQLYVRHDLASQRYRLFSLIKRSA